VLRKDVYTKEEVDEKLWNLAIATHSIVKGLLGAMGMGGAFSESIIEVKQRLYPEKGYEDLKKQVVDAIKERGQLQNGDVVVVTEKIFAAAQNRLIPIDLILERDPHKINLKQRMEMAKDIEKLLDAPVNETDLILADTYVMESKEVMATVGVYNPNKVAYEIAQLIKQDFDVDVDVIIKDTDTGVDVCETIIGCFTLGATPLGATKGLCLYECMRNAVCAEFVMGHNKGVPIVICRPIARNIERKDMGEFRGYDGRLDYEKEDGLAFENNEMR
jgi:F420-0:gamma-glutamyl ligase